MAQSGAIDDPHGLPGQAEVGKSPVMFRFAPEIASKAPAVPPRFDQRAMNNRLSARAS